MNRHYKYGTILEERPDLIKCLLNSDDSNYHIGSAVKVDWICPNCGSIIRGKSVNKVISRGIPCQICSDTSTQSIIPQVSDILTDINVTPIIDDIKCELDAANSLVYQCSDLWNQGKWTGEISNILGISVVSVITYLKRGAHLGICDYTPLKAHQLSQQGAVGLKQKAVRCIETGEVFTSLANACRRYKVSSASNIIRSCNNHKCHAGVTPDGVKLSWEYYITS